MDMVFSGIFLGKYKFFWWVDSSIGIFIVNSEKGFYVFIVFVFLFS